MQKNWFWGFLRSCFRPQIREFNHFMEKWWTLKTLGIVFILIAVIFILIEYVCPMIKNFFRAIFRKATGPQM